MATKGGALKILFIHTVNQAIPFTGSHLLSFSSKRGSNSRIGIGTANARAPASCGSARTLATLDAKEDMPGGVRQGEQEARLFPRAKAKPPVIADQGFWDRSLTMTYSHMGRPHTTIGDASFHF